jgi:hypothetical protein
MSVIVGSISMNKNTLTFCFSEVKVTYVKTVIWFIHFAKALRLGFLLTKSIITSLSSPS